MPDTFSVDKVGFWRRFGNKKQSDARTIKQQSVIFNVGFFEKIRKDGSFPRCL